MARRVTPERFRHVMGHFGTGVAVVTAEVGDARFGATVNALCSLSVEPPRVLVCLNEQSHTGRALRETTSFVINILQADQKDMARRFATQAVDKFEGVPVRDGEVAGPVLSGVLAHLECKVNQRVRTTTHDVILADVLEARAYAGVALAYFRGRFHQLVAVDDAGR